MKVENLRPNDSFTHHEFGKSTVVSLQDRAALCTSALCSSFLVDNDYPVKDFTAGKPSPELLAAYFLDMTAEEVIIFKDEVNKLAEVKHFDDDIKGQIVKGLFE